VRVLFGSLVALKGVERRFGELACRESSKLKQPTVDSKSTKYSLKQHCRTFQDNILLTAIDVKRRATSTSCEHAYLPLIALQKSLLDILPSRLSCIPLLRQAKRRHESRVEPDKRMATVQSQVVPQCYWDQ